MIRIFANRLVAICIMGFIGLTSIGMFPIALVIWVMTARFDKRLKLLHRFTSLWASLYLWLFPLWSVDIVNREKIDPNKIYVIVSNHRSLVDILAVFALFTHFKWVGNSDHFKLPLIGWNMLLNRYVRLRRGGKGNRNNIKKMYRACEKHLKRGSSIFLFPEGTRSGSGEPGPFREGAFVLAKRRGIPVLPLVISGSEATMENDRLYFLRRARITITVLDEVSPDTFQDISSKILATQVRETITADLSHQAQ
jgi:1-acyl-sn-glycerol-3-phosphate acyltransferase